MHDNDHLHACTWGMDDRTQTRALRRERSSLKRRISAMEHNIKRMKADYSHLSDTIRVVETRLKTQTLAARVRGLHAGCDECVVVYDFTDQQLFGVDAYVPGPGVKVAPLHVVVDSMKAFQWLDTETCTLTGTSCELHLGTPLPPGWMLDSSLDTRDLFDKEVLSRAADTGLGEYFWYSSTDFHEGVWSAALIWRVFYDETFTGRPGPSPSDSDQDTTDDDSDFVP